VSEDFWSAQDTTPAAIEAALREMLHKRYLAHEGFVPARVLNLVVIVDREWRGEIANRLDQVGRYHASRTVLCSVDPGRSTIDARATMSYEDIEPAPGQIAVCVENVEIDIGPQHLAGLDTIVDPLLVTDLVTVVWSPHGHAEGVDALMDLAHVVLLDSVEEPEPRAALDRVAELGESAYVVDLAWLRSTPWRERTSATFDPPQWRPALRHISGVIVRHRPDSLASALLFVGWLSSRLGWQCSLLHAHDGTYEGRLGGRRQDVSVRLDASAQMSVPGLAGITIETADGTSISLDRGPGGLSAMRRLRDGAEQRWTVLGASRGEGGILGEGVRQALLRDPTYRPALDSARAMLPAGL